MTDRILQKYTGRTGEGTLDATLPAEVDAADDLGSFGWLRGIRDRAIMLELRQKTGNVVAIGYNWIEKIEFDPSEGITLCALGQRIRIKGRNLNAEVRPTVRLFEGIVRHKVPWIQQADETPLAKLDKRTAVVDQIDW